MSYINAVTTRLHATGYQPHYYSPLRRRSTDRTRTVQLTGRNEIVTKCKT